VSVNQFYTTSFERMSEKSKDRPLPSPLLRGEGTKFLFFKAPSRVGEGFGERSSVNAILLRHCLRSNLKFFISDFRFSESRVGFQPARARCPSYKSFRIAVSME
jgi:hypothetical protein